MDGRAFLNPARDLASGPTEAYWRAAVVNAYYALLLEWREALHRWGIVVPPRQNVHSFVRLELLYAQDADLKTVGYALDELVQLRNQASYDLSPSVEFASVAVTQQAIQLVVDDLALLDAIEADPSRRAAAIAALPP